MSREPARKVSLEAVHEAASVLTVLSSYDDSSPPLPTGTCEGFLDVCSRRMVANECAHIMTACRKNNQ